MHKLQKKTLILKSSKCPYALNIKARSNMSVHIRQKNLAYNYNKKSRLSNLASVNGHSILVVPTK